MTSKGALLVLVTTNTIGAPINEVATAEDRSGAEETLPFLSIAGVGKVMKLGLKHWTEANRSGRSLHRGLLFPARAQVFPARRAREFGGLSA
jgi:hypothetical protein